MRMSKSSTLNRQNKKLCTCCTLFWTFHCHHGTTMNWKYLTCTFTSHFIGMWTSNNKIIFLFLNLEIIHRNLTPRDFACIWQSKPVGIITIANWKNTNSIFKRCLCHHCCLSILNSLLGIPVTQFFPFLPFLEIKVSSLLHLLQHTSLLDALLICNTTSITM